MGLIIELKVTLLETKQMRSTNIFFDNFIEIVYFFVYLLIENVKLESYCFERNNKIWYLNGYDFELYQTTFHIKNYNNKLFNSTALFAVYKWPLKTESVVIN